MMFKFGSVTFFCRIKYFIVLSHHIIRHCQLLRINDDTCNRKSTHLQNYKYMYILSTNRIAL